MSTMPTRHEQSQEQAAGLIAVADELGRRVANTQDSRRRTALIALRCLARFAEKQFQLFGHGFGPDSPLVPDERFPTDYLIEATIHQATADIDVLLQSMAHRHPAFSTPAMRGTLANADRLAAAAMELAARHHLIEETVALTYFHKSPAVRLIPYAPLAVVGIDLAATTEPERMLAVAHEIGHHVYRQMTVNYLASLDEQVITAPAAAATPAPNPWPVWLLAWTEEIFADIYATLVGGPAAAYTIQNHIQTGLPGRFLIDDGDHPLEALRPAIHLATLKCMARVATADVQRSLEHAIAALEQNWLNVLAQRGEPVTFQPAGTNDFVSLPAAADTLRRYVQELLKSALTGLCQTASNTAWSRGLEADDPAGLPDLLRQYTSTLDALNDRKLPELVMTDGGRRVVVEPQQPGLSGGERTIGQIGDEHLDALRDRALTGKAKLKEEEWKAIFLAGDWVTQTGGSGIIPLTIRGGSGIIPLTI